MSKIKLKLVNTDNLTLCEKVYFGKFTEKYPISGASRIALCSFNSLTLQSCEKRHLTYQPAFFDCIEVKQHLARLAAKKQQSLVIFVPSGI